jgi:hypothetical protein
MNAMSYFKRAVLHPFLIAGYPVLALLVVNIKEIEPGVALRPFILALLLAGILLLLTRLAVKDIHRAALITTFLLILFFSYGHVYDAIKGTNQDLARHRYLAPVYLAILGLGLWWMLRKVKNFSAFTETLNVVGILLIAFSFYQTAVFYISVAKATEEAEKAAELTLTPPQDGELPDIYYILLDTFTRQDALIRDYDLDISEYLDDLRAAGFYVAECSQSNYPHTMASFSTSLNMEYAVNLEIAKGIAQDDLWIYIQQSEVRHQLEALGYQTVAFETGFKWSQIEDADIYMSRGSAGWQISPFEVMLLDSTAFRLISDSRYLLVESDYNSNPFASHISRQLFMLDSLTEIPANPDPTFTIAHVLIPHPPYVFGPDGEIVTDPGFYGGKNGDPINAEYKQEGYRNQVLFITKRISAIAKEIVAKSDVPPIIIIQGDHGLSKRNRTLILNIYYMPDGGDENLYPNITPVNSFRVIFNTYFGGDYPLLLDLAHYENEVVPETAPNCLP